jgi:hypothetical protein
VLGTNLAPSMVELGLDGDEGPDRGDVVPKLDVIIPLNGEGGYESYELEPKGGLGRQTQFRRAKRTMCLMGNLGRRPCSL